MQIAKNIIQSLFTSTAGLSAAYRIRTVGCPETLAYRTFLENEAGHLISPFHDIVPIVNEEHGLVQMVVEIPRWSNAKLEIATGEFMNPIKQDIKKGQLRYVKNIFPFHGYPWNYGAIPQTWEDPNEVCVHTGYGGDKDPIDILDIGEVVGFTGQVKTVKVLGAIVLIDEGETDWKIIAIDIHDPLAEKLNDIDDVNTFCPGLLDATRHWFKVYKRPDGKPENTFGMNAEYQNKSFAMNIIKSVHQSWLKLVNGKTLSKSSLYDIDCSNMSCQNSPYNVESTDPRVCSVTSNGVSVSNEEKKNEVLSGDVTRSYYGYFASCH